MRVVSGCRVGAWIRHQWCIQLVVVAEVGDGADGSIRVM